MKLMSSIIACGLALLGSGVMVEAARAEGPCVTFRDPRGLEFVYNPFNPAPASVPFELIVERNDPSVTSVRFMLIDHDSPIGLPRLGRAGPRNYDIVWMGDTGRTVFAATGPVDLIGGGATVGFGSGVSGGRRTPNFRLTAPSGEPVPTVFERESLDVAYQCYKGADAGPIETQSGNRVSIDMAVLRFFGAFVGSPGVNSGTIDFGDLVLTTPRPVKSTTVTARSTVPYTVGITSERHQMLKQSASDTSGIPYDLRYAGLPVRDGATLDCPIPLPPSGDRAEVEVTLDGRNIRSLPAGSYQDTITLTFTPNDGGRLFGNCRVARAGRN